MIHCRSTIEIDFFVCFCLCVIILYVCRSLTSVSVTHTEQQGGAEAYRKQFRSFVTKQERLLYLCFHVLLNLAEDPHVERKMKKRNICSYLCSLLYRDNVELLLLVVTFLKKLSVVTENIAEIVRLSFCYCDVLSLYFPFPFFCFVFVLLVCSCMYSSSLS